MPERVRIDKWLWAARFFKTRSLAAQAVAGAKARLNGESVKPAKEVKQGDVLVIRIGEFEWTVTVAALSERRGPAQTARSLYSEDAASLARRQAAIELRTLQPPPMREERGRPTKKDRRLIRRFTEEN